MQSASGRRIILILSAVVMLMLYATAAFAAAGPLITTPVASFPTTAVGGTPSAQTVTVTFPSGGTPSTIQVLTSGAPNLDFSYQTGGTCSAGTNYTSGQSCTVAVSFTPLYPGRRFGAVLVQASDNSLIAETLIQGDATGALPTLKPGQMSTVAGNGNTAYNNADGQLAIYGQLNLPNSVVVDGAGNFYLSDQRNARIRIVDAATQHINTYAGDFVSGYSGDGGPATSASINEPAGLALDGAGNLYFADYQANVVRRVDAVTKIITTVAGQYSATSSSTQFGGDGGPATSAFLSRPVGIAIDGSGNLLIADSQNQRIRKVDAVTGIITTIAGTGQQSFLGDGGAATNAALNSPQGVFVAPNGVIYIADSGNSRIRTIATDSNHTIQTITGGTIAQYGGDGGLASAATLNNPLNVALDPAGDVYITDSGSFRLRMINNQTGNIETVAGTSSSTFAGDGGPANKANLYNPSGVFFAPNGDIYVTDVGNNRIRKISVQALTLTFSTMKVGKTSAPYMPLQGLANEGTDPLLLSDYAPTANQSALDASTTTCTFGTAATALAPSTTCSLGVQFKPTTVASPDTGTLKLPSTDLTGLNVTSLAPVITLQGNVLTVNPTTTAVAVLAPSTNPSILGTPVTFQATVVSDDTARTGTVAFTIDGTAVTGCASVTLASSGTASCTANNLTLGSHAVVATYSGDDKNAASTSDPYTQVVKQHIDLALTSSANPAVVTKPVTFTLVATATTGVPTGSVIFLDGTTTIGTANLASSGTTSASASITVSNLIIGTHSITAQYSGDTANAPGTSTPAVAQVINEGGTATTVSSSGSPSIPVGQSITFSASVSSLSGLSTPTGTIAFRNGTTTLGTATVQADGSASLTLPNLAAGTYSIVAAYLGDTNDATSNSTPVAQAVTRLPTVVAITSDSTPLNAGATLHLSAKVTVAPGSTAYGTLSGTVTFTEGLTVLGSGTVAADGTVTIAVAGLSVGTHNIVASYSGDSNYAVNSASLSQAVVQTATNIAVAVATPSVLSGKPATFVATVTSNTGTPTGSVVFKDGATTIGTVNLTNGTATFSTSSLSVGQHTLTATYSGDVNYLTITSAPFQQTVTLATTTLALTGPTAPVVVTTAANFSAALSSPGVAPGGTLTLYDGAAAIGSKTISGTGAVSFSTTTLSVGQHTITVGYSGDTNNAASTSAVVIVTVTKSDTSTSLVTSVTPAVLGNDVTFTIGVSSSVTNLSGTVSLLDGAAVVGSATVVNGTATIILNNLAFGDHTLTASYSGDAQHSASTSPAIKQRIIQAASVKLVSSLNPALSGQLVVFTASVPGAAGLIPTGTVTFSDGATVLAAVTLNAAGQATAQSSQLAVGGHTITAAYSGDTNFQPAQTNLTETVNIATTRIAIAVSADPATFGAVTDLTATVQSDGGTATGTVQFTEAGAVIGAATLNSNGVAVLHTSALAPGRHTVVGNYISDGKAAAATSSAVSFLVKQQTSLVLASSANPALTLSDVILTATLQSKKAVAATGSIVFLDGGKAIGTAALDSNGVATLDLSSPAVGSHTITATYAGDDADFQATAAALTQAVQLRSTRTAVSYSFTNASDPQQVTLIVVVGSTQLSPLASPSGSVTLYNGTTTVGTGSLDVNGTASFTVRLESGQTGSFTAKYAGDTAYAASTSSATSVKSGSAAQFYLTVSNPDPTIADTLTVARGQHIAVLVTASSVSGFNDTLKLGCIGLPYAATCTFTKNGSPSTSLTLGSNASSDLQLVVDTGNPLGSGTETGSLRRSTEAVLCLLPACLLLCGKHRRRRIWPVLLIVFAMAASMGVTGCGGLAINSTPAGTYTFQVTAVGQGTGITETKTLTLVVGQ